MCDVEADGEELSLNVVGERKKTKSSTQFLAGPMSRARMIAIMASVTRPKTKPALAVPKGAT